MSHLLQILPKRFLNTYMFHLSLYILLLSLTACTPENLTPISNANHSNYAGKATILIAVEGSDERAVRHIEIMTKEEPEGFVIYFHDKKVSNGFISVTLPTPSTQIRLSEYSLTGMYGCSRGKSGYGYGTKILPKITQDNTYFLGTIHTNMNTMYDEMPDTLVKEAKIKYHYIAQGSDIKKRSSFQSTIKL